MVHVGVRALVFECSMQKFFEAQNQHADEKSMSSKKSLCLSTQAVISLRLKTAYDALV